MTARGVAGGISGRGDGRTPQVASRVDSPLGQAAREDTFAQVAGVWDGWQIACDRCRQPYDGETTLFARIGHEQVCASCWHRAGRPFPPPASMAAVHEAQVATRQRMEARGGADRHLVRKGLT